ncbi:DUF1631 family protein [Rhodoferax sp.]|uniref:DUF1631 family protein n=1 Tax=Rhodoferax sp. TaxID=50421 RepID=UPI001ED3E45E|nr:DUF1631 family protein [Rhodoferax sp.]MBT9507498.1 DUF1631 family protein [Rhodoferax sp.]
MATPPSFAQRAQLAQETRRRFVIEAGRAMVELGTAVQERLTALMNEAAPSREMQTRRDAWTFYQRNRAAWLDGTMRDWQSALKPPVAAPKKSLDAGLELVGTEVVENKIVASRLVLGVMEKVSNELNDLRLRIRHLEGAEDLEGYDILRPEVLLLLMIEQWATVGMPRDAWPLVNDVAQKLLIERLTQAYANCNEFLIKQGVLPTIELKDRVKRAPSAPARSASPPGSPPGQTAAEKQSGRDSGPGGYYGDAGPQGGQASQRSAGAFGGRLGWGNESGGPSPSGSAEPAGSRARDSGPGAPIQSQYPSERHSSGHSSGYGGAADETRMMTSATPLARARSRALGVMGQLKRLLVGTGGANFEATSFQPPSPALAAAMAVRSRPDNLDSGAGSVVDYSPAGIARVAGQLRERTTELKNKAETKSEKATIEIVALMFQAILQEDRIPPGIRVWFARLQMPVLRVALAEPDFFGTLNHPARQLIDRMGSCVMGFDASGINGGALETEIKRIVQVIEQYPETGKRVYQLVYDEFQKFLAQFLTGKDSTQKVVSVAQQVEQKETLTIQYTIEMRNMLKDMPVREEIREFLFKVWAEVLAVAAVRKGPQHVETLGLKKSATDLVWAASAKPNRVDRARVIQDLPQLLQKLRAGMTLLGVAPSEQEAHIKTVSDTLADAFLSKTQAIPPEQIQLMAKRLANLEDFVSEDGMGDLPLDAESIEMMLGIDASTIDVVADGGSKPTAAMLAWAQELQLGSWFTLDHNGRVAQVQFVWRSDRKHLNLFASTDGHSYLVQAGRLAAYLQAGLLLPQEEETLTVRATRDALSKLAANPERLLG